VARVDSRQVYAHDWTLDCLVWAEVQEGHYDRKIGNFDVVGREDMPGVERAC